MITAARSPKAVFRSWLVPRAPTPRLRNCASISFRVPPGLVSWQGRVVSPVYTAPKSYITKSAAGGLARGRLHQRHAASRGATEGRPKKQPKNEPTPGHHKKGEPEPATGKKPPSLRKGRTTDKEGMAGHGVRNPPGSVRSYERSRKMRWVLR